MNFFECTPPDVLDEAAVTENNTMPSKSKERYEKQYQRFVDWKALKKASRTSENVLLAYIGGRANEINSATLWSEFSMLKTTIKINENIDIGKYHKVQAFLKQNSKGYKPKKSNTLNEKQCITFLKDAPNETFLMMKVALIMGIYGACSRGELTNMKWEDVKKKDDCFLVTIPETKNYVSRHFIITNQLVESINMTELILQYQSLRPPHTPHNRLFIYYKNKKCSTLPVGKNTFSKIPSRIATFLKLDQPNLYTGHCFRRSSDLLAVKKHGGWKSSTIAEGYIDQSITNKKTIAINILRTTTVTSTETREVENNTNIDLPSTSQIIIHNHAQGIINIYNK